MPGSGRNHNLPRTRKPDTPTPGRAHISHFQPHPLPTSRAPLSSEQAATVPPGRFFLMYDSTYISALSSTPFANTGALAAGTSTSKTRSIRVYTHMIPEQRGWSSRIYVCCEKFLRKFHPRGWQCRAVIYRISKVTRRS